MIDPTKSFHYCVLKLDVRLGKEPKEPLTEGRG